MDAAGAREKWGDVEAAPFLVLSAVLYFFAADFSSASAAIFSSACLIGASSHFLESCKSTSFDLRSSIRSSAELPFTSFSTIPIGKIIAIPTLRPDMPVFSSMSFLSIFRSIISLFICEQVRLLSPTFVTSTLWCEHALRVRMVVIRRNFFTVNVLCYFVACNQYKLNISGI
jgi:hypothetical protein